MVDVFVSYKREERERCEHIVRRLRALELDVWFDARLTSGMSFDREIEQTLEKAAVVLVLWSPKSVESEWVRNEATFGKEQDKLAAIQIAPCDLPLSFASTHYETIHEADFGDDHPGWLKLLERVGTLTKRPDLAGFSQALASAQAGLQVWARNHPDDPLSVKAKQIVRELSERPVVPGEKQRIVRILRAALDMLIVLTAAAALTFAASGWILELGWPENFSEAVDLATRTIKVLLLSDIYYDAYRAPSAQVWMEYARALGPATMILVVIRFLTFRMTAGLYRVYR